MGCGAAAGGESTGFTSATVGGGAGAAGDARAAGVAGVAAAGVNEKEAADGLKLKVEALGLKLNELVGAAAPSPPSSIAASSHESAICDASEAFTWPAKRRARNECGWSTGSATTRAASTWRAP
jgi:hypothetical protein